LERLVSGVDLKLDSEAQHDQPALLADEEPSGEEGVLGCMSEEGEVLDSSSGDDEDEETIPTYSRPTDMEVSEVVLMGEVVLPQDPSVLVRVDLVEQQLVVSHAVGDLPISPMAVQVEECADPPSPLICTPLAIVAPSMAPDSFGTPLLKGMERSKWVKHQYHGMCKLVGFPLDCHEQQCLDLLQRIEATRVVKKREMGPKRVLVSGSKGARELKNLTLSVNYEGKHRTCC
jgi:hypothetical protein